MTQYKKYKVKTKETKKKGTKTKTKWKTHSGEKGKTVTYDFEPKDAGYIDEHGMFVPNQPDQPVQETQKTVSRYKHGGVVQHD
jgi:hypothetical protein